MKTLSEKIHEFLKEAAFAMALSNAGMRGDMETVMMLENSRH
jgi:hypothetical protein